MFEIFIVLDLELVSIRDNDKRENSVDTNHFIILSIEVPTSKVLAQYNIHEW